MRILPTCLLLVLALPGTAAAVAPAPTPVPTGVTLDEMTVDPALLAAIRAVKAADYPSANAVFVVDDQSVVFQKGADFTNTTRLVRVVLTPSGLESAAWFGLDYAKDAERMTVLMARVIKPDGTVVPVPASDIKDTDQSGDMNIYDPNGRSIKVTFEGLAVGDAVDIRYRLERFTPTRPGVFADEFMFQSTEPIAEATYAVDGPATMPLTAELYHPERGAKVVATKATAGDRIHYSWSTRAVPQVVPENDMDFSQELPMLVVSTDPSWESFSRWWAGLTDAQIQPTPGLEKEVAELTKNAKTDDQKVRALYDFVSTDIRYRGLGVGPRTGYTPRRADDTFTSRWGVCRDVSILLTTMLRIAGLQAYPVLTNVGDPVLPKVAYDGFNHAIVAMPAPGGGWTFLDPTAKNSSDLLPANEREQSVLVCTPKGEPLGTIPPAPPSASLGHATAKTVVAADGTMTSDITLETTGIFDLEFRSWATQMAPKQLHDLAERVIHSRLPSAELVSFESSDALDLAKPMTIRLSIKVPDAAAVTGNYQILGTAVTSGALGLVEWMMPQMLGGLPSRKYGLDAGMSFQYDEDESVALPQGVKVLALPNPVHSSNGVSGFDSTCERQPDGSVACHRSFQLKSRFVSPKQYLALRQVLGSMSQLGRQPVILSAMGVN